MKRKLIAVGSITVLICVVLGSIVACTATPTPTTEYDLTISSTAGGSITTPGEGTFTYDEGTVVDLVAEADEGYHFVNWSGDVGTITGVSAAATSITMNGDYEITANFAQYMVSARGTHTVGVKSDGTVVATGDNTYEQLEVGSWTDIVQVAAGGYHTVGLKDDGTVVAVGWNNHEQLEVGGWTDISQVSAGLHHTVVLDDDGTAVAVGSNGYGQCDVGGWTDIVQVAAAEINTVGLKHDGTVVAVGNNDYGQCSVGDWDLN